ncbi:MAG TPA: hypothetical protein VJ508_16575, partial [Saprospiraceae bacterium]|nr:hypothetical protein [Saprospiraceae bacterium]
MDKIPLEALKDSEFTFSGKLNDNISLGGDYRSQFLYDGFSKTSAFNAMTAAIYGAVTLSKKFTFFFKQDIVNGTYGGMYDGYLGGTEAFGLAKVLPSGYIKGGVFLPDYGLRYDDHTVYTRGGDLGFTGAGFHPGLLFTPNYKDIGVEVGFNIGNLMITSGLFDGSGNTDPLSFSVDKAYVAKISYQGSASDLNYLIGVSGYGFRSYKMGGVSVGFGINDFVFLGEVDLTHENLINAHSIDNRPAVSVGFNSMALLA